MALPKLNSSPKYEMTIPSTGEEVRFRPFLIKEEKTMLIAAETGDSKIILKSLLDTLKACVDSDINESNLSTFDIEYMFLKLRAKSVGETTKVGIKCEKCDHQNTLDVNISEIEIEKPKDVSNKIKLTEDITVEMGYPTFGDLVKVGVDTAAMTNAENLFKMINQCFKTVITEDEKFVLKEHSEEEITAFIDSLDASQFVKVREYIESIPRLKHDFKLKCSQCGHVTESSLEGLANFFG